VRASEFGFQASDSTRALQAALDSGADTVIVDNMGADWVTGPLFVRHDNMKIVFQNGAVVTAKPGSFQGDNDSLITLYDRTNVVLSGYGATLRMNKSEYTGQWRMVVKLLSVKNVRVEGLTVRDSGGDGVYIGNSNSARGISYSEDVHVKDVSCINNHRQGITVISGQNVLIENCWIVGSNGTQPQGGIGLEPNSYHERLVNIHVRDVRLEENRGPCLIVSSNSFNSTSMPMSVTMERFLCRSSVATGGIAFSGPGAGLVEFKDGLIENQTDTGISGFRKPAYGAAQFRFTRCVIRNVGNVPVYLSGVDPGAREYGGVEWVDTVAENPVNGTVLSTGESSDSFGVANLRGQLTVFDSKRPFTLGLTSILGLVLGSKAHDISLMVSHRGAQPQSTVSVAASGKSFVISRSSSDVSFPLAVVYEAPGGNLPGAAVIPPGAANVTVTPVLPAGCIQMSLSWRPAYSVGGGPARVCSN